MLRKVFIQCQFGAPHPWSEQYYDHFKKLEKHGWYMLVFTPNAPNGFTDSSPRRSSEGNITFWRMTVEEYDELLFKKTGVRANNHLTDKGVPAKLISDHYVAWGQVFQDCMLEVADFDYWGITNFDMVYGRLSKYVPDADLIKYDIWADEDNPAINGIFTLFRNDERINNLFRMVPNWEQSFAVHQPTAFDEIQMSEVVRTLNERGLIKVGHPEHGPLHNHDRLPQHQPRPNLYIEPDGALMEKYQDTVFPPARRDHHRQEIAMFHFSRTKAWPIAN
jgi:hypothetical protein